MGDQKITRVAAVGKHVIDDDVPHVRGEEEAREVFTDFDDTKALLLCQKRHWLGWLIGQGHLYLDAT